MGRSDTDSIANKAERAKVIAIAAQVGALEVLYRRKMITTKINAITRNVTGRSAYHPRHLPSISRRQNQACDGEVRQKSPVGTAN
jgi:hypothetical protein